MFTTGCGDIAHLTVIALDRMMAIASPIKYRAWAQKPALTAAGIIFSWMYGFLWAFLPLVGKLTKLPHVKSSLPQACLDCFPVDTLRLKTAVMNALEN